MELRREEEGGMTASAGRLAVDCEPGCRIGVTSEHGTLLGMIAVWWRELLVKERPVRWLVAFLLLWHDFSFQGKRLEEGTMKQ